MRRSLAAAALAVTLMSPVALYAQQTSSAPSSHATTSSKTSTASKNAGGKNGQHHRDRRSPWSNVLVTGVNAQNYLASPAPLKTPGKNKVNKPGGTVFKSISN